MFYPASSLSGIISGMSQIHGRGKEIYNMKHMAKKLIDFGMHLNIW